MGVTTDLLPKVIVRIEYNKGGGVPRKLLASTGHLMTIFQINENRCMSQKPGTFLNKRKRMIVNIFLQGSKRK